MHRIDGPGATPDYKFTEGDPASATPATTVTDDWLNAVQEEIIGVISDPVVTPAIPLNKSNNGQLALAIKRIAAAFVAIVQATESVLGGAKVATQTEAETGASDAVMLTPKKAMLGFVVLLAANGYIKFPSIFRGFMIQWGTASTVSGTVNFTFPTTYPSACVAVAPIATSGITVSLINTVKSVSGGTITATNSSTGAALSMAVTYISIGY